MEKAVAEEAVTALRKIAEELRGIRDELAKARKGWS